MFGDLELNIGRGTKTFIADLLKDRHTVNPEEQRKAFIRTAISQYLAANTGKGLNSVSVLTAAQWAEELWGKLQEAGY